MAAPVLPSNKPPSLQRRGTATSTLIIPSRTGHRRTLIDYFVKASAGSYADISIGNVVWNRIYDNLTQAVLISDLTERFENKGFLRYLAGIIPEFPFPTAAQDEDIVIARAAAPTRMDAYFRDTTEGDVVSHTVAGGSMATKHLLIINLANNSDIAASGTYYFDKLDMPSGLTPFSEGVDIVAGARRMASNQRFTIYAIAGDFPKAGSSKTTRVHILEEQIELFASENGEGLLVDPDAGNELAFDLKAPSLFRLPDPYVFEPNKLYSFKGEATYDGTNALSAGSQKLILIGIREYIA